MLNNLVRVVLEKDNNDFMELRASNLSNFTTIFGEDLLTAFCCCYIQADRLTSLVYFIHTANEYENNFIASRRNEHTFLFLVFGILKELKESLSLLNTHLVKKNVFDKEVWEKGLGRWLEYAKKEVLIKLRNKAGFHINFDQMQKGLKKVISSHNEFSILEWEKGNGRNGLAIEALLQGTDLSMNEMKDLVKEFETLLLLKNELDYEFLRVLKLLNLEPIQVYKTSK